jgi:glycosyltransferase involved in cell wall biosynthesis
VILPYTFFPNVACGLVWKWTGARSCFWNQRDVIEYRLGRGIDRWAIKQIPVFVANARHTAEFLAAYLGAPAQRIHVVHNGVELAPPQASRQVWRQRLQVNEAAFVACMVANLSSIKDHATLLRAWRVVCDRLGREGRQPLLVLAGRPADATASLKPLAAELRLGESVCFLGFEPDIAGLLGAVEAGVFCSHRESFPNGVLEGMAMGLPVVATDLPATREALGDPGQAWLAPPGDASVLADKICALAQDPALRRRLGGLNQERVQDHFSPQQMTRRMTALMGQVLRGQPEEMNRG